MSLCAVRKVGFAVLLLTTGSVVVGCNDGITPATPELDRQAEHVAARPAAGGEFLTDARFALDLSAKGPFVPGGNIVVHYGVTSHMSSNAMVTLSVPDLVGSNPRIVKRGPSARIEPRVRTSRSLTAEETVAGTLPLTISEPGYYRVLLSAVDTQAPMIQPNGRFVQNVAHRELWLWVDENGGFVTKGFDLGALPDTVRPFIGARWFKPGHGTPPAALSVARNAAGSNQARARYTVVSPNQIGGVIEYFEPAPVDSFVPLGSGRISLEVWDEYSGQQEWGQEDYAEPATDGTFVLECPFTPNERYDYTFHLDANEITFGGAGNSTLHVYSTDCGYGNFSLGPPSVYGHEFALAVRVSNLARELYGRERTTGLLVEVTGSIPGSRYQHEQPWGPSPLSFPDRIQISTDSASGYGDQIWGARGNFTFAHEYGHAFQDRALGGFANTDSACQYHVLYGVETPHCAWVEGFADFNAVALLGNETALLDTIELNADLPYTWDGITVEGAVAAFLLDLSDGANEASDPFAGSVQYVGDLVATCSIFSTWWRHNYDASHIVYCAENQVDPVIKASYFGASVYQATAQSNSASLPSGWSIANVRTVWKHNLYDQ